MPFCILKGDPDDVIRARCYERATLLGPFDIGVQRGVRIAESERLWDEAPAVRGRTVSVYSRRSGRSTYPRDVGLFGW
jgi:hypothetical protein